MVGPEATKQKELMESEIQSMYDKPSLEFGWSHTWP